MVLWNLKIKISSVCLVQLHIEDNDSCFLVYCNCFLAHNTLHCFEVLYISFLANPAHAAAVLLVK